MVERTFDESQGSDVQRRAETTKDASFAVDNINVYCDVAQAITAPTKFEIIVATRSIYVGIR